MSWNYLFDQNLQRGQHGQNEGSASPEYPDTEEATYIWHFDKNISSLKEHLASIDSALNTIRNQGRQFYLESKPVNFSRIIHDYSDDRKGFIQWKDELEEKLY